MEKETEDGAVPPQEPQHSVSLSSTGETCELQAAVNPCSFCEWLGAVFKQRWQRASGVAAQRGDGCDCRLRLQPGDTVGAAGCGCTHSVGEAAENKVVLVVSWFAEKVKQGKAELNTLLDWVSNNVKDFPLNGPLQLEAWQAVAQRLFNIARDGNAEACSHLSTWGTVMAAIKRNCMNIDHCAALEADSPEPSSPPEPLYDPKMNPYFKEFPVELPNLEINPSPMELRYPDKNPCAVSPLSAEFPYHEQAAVPLPAQDDSAVVQRWQKREAAMGEGDLVVVTACPIIHVPNQGPVYRELDYKVIRELRALVKESGVSSHHALSYLESISTICKMPHFPTSLPFTTPTLAFPNGHDEALEITRFYSALVKPLLECCVQFLMLQFKEDMELLEWA
ncbi:hypothetical protein DUI87_09954 [Hirundo rustica rustica]|uniref:Uncharacterized protein n=1 Tax=Hirundo rustica rustica TaxID=333673 RepID=A0A3M0KGS0_HIRRU|nr:hypothetical protein DUI87_09954 [Hirundo rustica rustica]